MVFAARNCVSYTPQFLITSICCDVYIKIMAALSDENELQSNFVTYEQIMAAEQQIMWTCEQLFAVARRAKVEKV